jgi:hypothetical protein
MALQKNLDTVYGINIPDAYFRVTSAVIQNKNCLGFTVNSYADKNLQAIGSSQYSCEYDINGENPLKQAYIYLRTLEEFSTAIDC